MRAQYIRNIFWHYINLLDHTSMSYVRKIGHIRANSHPIAALGGKDGLADFCPEIVQTSASSQRRKWESGQNEICDSCAHRRNKSRFRHLRMVGLANGDARRDSDRISHYT